MLAAQDSNSFIECAAHVGDALWSSDTARLQKQADSLGRASESELEACLNSGSARRTELKHYSGAMFYYGR